MSDNTQLKDQTSEETGMPKKNNQKAPKPLGSDEAGVSEVPNPEKNVPDAIELEAIELEATELEASVLEKTDLQDNEPEETELEDTELETTELEESEQQMPEPDSQDLAEAVSAEVIDEATPGTDNLEQDSSETVLLGDPVTEDLVTSETDTLETDSFKADLEAPEVDPDTPETDLPYSPETDSPETDEAELEAPKADSSESDAYDTDAPDPDAPDLDALASDALDPDALDESAKPSAMRYEDIEIEHFVPGKYQLDEDEDLTAEQQPEESSDEQFSPLNEGLEDSDSPSSYGSMKSPEVTATLLPYKQGGSENPDLQSAVVTPLLGQRDKKLWTKDSGDDGSETTTRRTGNALLWIGMIMILVALLIGGYLIFRYMAAASSYNRLATIAGLDTAALDDPTYTVEAKDLNIDWENLKAINPEIVAWIYIPGTNLSYPVVHGEDNEFYLTHTADGSYNTSGAIFLDYQNTPGYTDRSNWTYGHNMVAQTMFYPITNFTSEQFLAEHPRILVFTPEKTYDLTVIGAIRCSGTTPIRRTAFSSDADFNKYLTTLGSYQVSGKYSDMMAANNVFCFSTCDRLDRTVRIIVIATEKNTGDIDVPLPDNAPTSRLNTQSPDSLAAIDKSTDKLSLLVSPLMLSAILPSINTTARSLTCKQAKVTSSSKQQQKRTAQVSSLLSKRDTQASSLLSKHTAQATSLLSRSTTQASDQQHKSTAHPSSLLSISNTQASSRPNKRTTQAST